MFHFSVFVLYFMNLRFRHFFLPWPSFTFRKPLQRPSSYLNCANSPAADCFFCGDCKGNNYIVRRSRTIFQQEVMVKNQLLSCNTIRWFFTPPLEIVLTVNAIYEEKDRDANEKETHLLRHNARIVLFISWWTVTAYVYNTVYSEITACNPTLTRWLQHRY